MMLMMVIVNYEDISELSLKNYCNTVVNIYSHKYYPTRPKILNSITVAMFITNAL
jgi:hypothetical protein